ncbi:unnamed protein product [Boreogadus saida]
MVSQVGSHTHLTHLALKTEEKEDVDQTDDHNSVMAAYSLFTARPESMQETLQETIWANGDVEEPPAV